ncbi:MAG TPA: SUMF1/EgtB/PvdO family nonheme iron enzyme [Kofleriaceae bacterium]|nr:SUMF1/EgtB/PvdO family nonheme iron enzyme [Kofleriaceae bacterium]
MTARRAALALAVAGCVPGTDFGGTAYRCDVDPTCPDGFVCQGGVCVAPGDGADDPLIPAGTVVMGCAAGAGCAADAQPEHEVTVAAFAIDRTEVTEADYAACVAEEGCDPVAGAGQAADLPIRGVAWTDAAAFCAWRGARLPTEAEWERAARGSDARRFPWGGDDASCARAALAGCASEPVAVGSLDGDGPFGTADLVGNVAEWVADYYQSDYYAQAPASNPSGPTSGGERVIRGGSYLDAAADTSAWARRHADPLNPQPDVGFRCAD